MGMVNVSNYEKRFRKRKKAMFNVAGVTLDFDELEAGGFDIDYMKTNFKAIWNGSHWECYYISADVSFDDTTVNKVKKNISQFFRADPIVISYKKIVVK